MSMPWFHRDGEIEYGPHSAAEMKLAARGTIAGDTLVRRGADGEWVPAARVKGLLPQSSNSGVKPATPSGRKRPAGDSQHGQAAAREQAAGAESSSLVDASPKRFRRWLLRGLAAAAAALVLLGVRHVLAVRDMMRVATVMEAANHDVHFEYPGPEWFRFWCEEENERRRFGRLVAIRDRSISYFGERRPVEHPPADDDLARLFGIRTLKFIKLGEVTIGDHHLARLRGNRNLNYLELVEPKIGPAGFREIGRLTNLEGLGLRYAALDAERAAPLWSLDRLQFLAFTKCRFEPGAFAGCETLVNLETLYLNNMELTDEHLRHVAALPGLKKLHLAGTNLDDTQLARLAAIGTLRKLDCRETDVTERAANDFRKARPDCEFEWWTRR